MNFRKSVVIKGVFLLAIPSTIDAKPNLTNFENLKTASKQGDYRLTMNTSDKVFVSLLSKN